MVKFKVRGQCPDLAGESVDVQPDGNLHIELVPQPRAGRMAITPGSLRSGRSERRRELARVGSER